MVTEKEIGKMVCLARNPILCGKLLEITSEGRAVIQRPVGRYHTNAADVGVVSAPVPLAYTQTPTEKIRMLCSIISDEYPADDPRRVYAETVLDTIQ